MREVERNAAAVERQLESVADAALRFLAAHRVGKARLEGPLEGGFSLHRHGDQEDLYGLVDAVYVLYTLGRLDEFTDRRSRRRWADRIVNLQDAQGWFSRRNLRGHSREHVTAYAIGALTLLEVDPGEDHRARVHPLKDVRPLLRDPVRTRRWLERLGLEGPLDPLRKNLGWHYVWRGSHVGGGVAAALGMLGSRVEAWWDDIPSVAGWLSGYFDWLDAEADSATGLWRRAFWNPLFRGPTLIDLGGAAHFHWIYVRAGRPIRHPEAVIRSVLSLQKPSGLYREVPYCIDLDADFCLLRCWEQLSEQNQTRWRAPVGRSLSANFYGTLDALTAAHDFSTLYSDLHALPGALAALTECVRFPDFPYAPLLVGWRHPLERAWWL